MALGPSGEILVSDSTKNGGVYALVDAKKDFKPAERKKLADGLERPYGLAFWKGYLYIGEETSVKRYKYDAKNMSLGKGEEVVSLAGLGGGHWTRSLLFDSKGEKLYVGAGSRSNVSAGEDPRRAAINPASGSNSTGCIVRTWRSSWAKKNASIISWSTWYCRIPIGSGLGCVTASRISHSRADCRVRWWS